MNTNKHLTKETVIKAALDLADEIGLDSLSMRKLSSRLNVEAMSLYNHVRNKEDLLISLTDLVVSEFGLPGDNEDWRGSLCPIIENTRRVLLKHAWAAKLIQSQIKTSKIRLERADKMIGVFYKAGFSLQLAYKAHVTIESYVYGFVMQELNWSFSEESQGEVAGSIMEQLPYHEYPYLYQMLHSIVETGKPDNVNKSGGSYASDFNFGIKLLLDGLELLRQQEKQN